MPSPQKIDPTHFSADIRLFIALLHRHGEGIPVPVYILSLDSLIKNKAATARAKDLDDLRYLRRAAERPSSTGEAAEPL